MKSSYNVILPIVPFPNRSMYLRIGVNGRDQSTFEGYRRLADGRLGPAELCNLIRNRGDVVEAINGISVHDKPHKMVLQLFREASQGIYAVIQFRDCVAGDTQAKELPMVACHSQIGSGPKQSTDCLAELHHLEKRVDDLRGQLGRNSNGKTIRKVGPEPFLVTPALDPVSLLFAVQEQIQKTGKSSSAESLTRSPINLPEQSIAESSEGAKPVSLATGTSDMVKHEKESFGTTITQDPSAKRSLCPKDKNTAKSNTSTPQRGTMKHKLKEKLPVKKRLDMYSPQKEQLSDNGSSRKRLRTEQEQEGTVSTPTLGPLDLQQNVVSPTPFGRSQETSHPAKAQKVNHPPLSPSVPKTKLPVKKRHPPDQGVPVRETAGIPRLPTLQSSLESQKCSTGLDHSHALMQQETHNKKGEQNSELVKSPEKKVGVLATTLPDKAVNEVAHAGGDIEGKGTGAEPAYRPAASADDKNAEHFQHEDTTSGSNAANSDGSCSRTRKITAEFLVDSGGNDKKKQENNTDDRSSECEPQSSHVQISVEVDKNVSVEPTEESHVDRKPAENKDGAFHAAVDQQPCNSHGQRTNTVENVLGPHQQQLRNGGEPKDETKSTDIPIEAEVGTSGKDKGDTNKQNMAVECRQPTTSSQLAEPPEPSKSSNENQRIGKTVGEDPVLWEGANPANELKVGEKVCKKTSISDQTSMDVDDLSVDEGGVVRPSKRPRLISVPNPASGGPESSCTDCPRLYSVGTIVNKHFDGHGWFLGEIYAVEMDRYHIIYEDGDEEDYLFTEQAELDNIVVKDIEVETQQSIKRVLKRYGAAGSCEYVQTQVVQTQVKHDSRPVAALNSREQVQKVPQTSEESGDSVPHAGEKPVLESKSIESLAQDNGLENSSAGERGLHNCSQDPWSFYQNSRMSLRQVYETVIQHGVEEMWQVFKKRNSPSKGKRIKMLMTAIGGSLKRGYSPDQLFHALETIRGTKSLYTLANYINKAVKQAEASIDANTVTEVELQDCVRQAEASIDANAAAESKLPVCAEEAKTSIGVNAGATESNPPINNGELEDQNNGRENSDMNIEHKQDKKGEATNHDMAKSKNECVDADSSAAEKEWNERFAELCAYRRQMGHCLVPSFYSKNAALGAWVKEQRCLHSQMIGCQEKNSMTSEHIRLLESVGFVWGEIKPQEPGKDDPTGEKPTDKEDVLPEDPQISKETMKGNGISCAADGKADSHGECGKQTTTNTDADAPTKTAPHQSRPETLEWAEKFDQLCEYRKQTGHCLVLEGYKGTNALAVWVKEQRHQYQLMLQGQPSTMTAGRIRGLEAIGFVWSFTESASSVSSCSGVEEEETERENTLGNFVWVQCDQCKKWRVLLDGTQEDQLPETWVCQMNAADLQNQTCDDPERSEDWYEAEFYRRLRPSSGQCYHE